MWKVSTYVSWVKIGSETSMRILLIVFPFIVAGLIVRALFASKAIKGKPQQNLRIATLVCFSPHRLKEALFSKSSYHALCKKAHALIHCAFKSIT
jgi:hypothetical protein